MGVLGLIVIAGGSMHSASSRYGAEISSTTVCKEVVNGTTFVSKVETKNGAARHVWTINGRDVVQEEFEEELLDAEKEERRREREKSQQRALKEHQFKERVIQSGYMKLVRQSLAAVERELATITTLKLEPFLSFSMQSFATREQYDMLHHELMPQAYAILEHFDSEQAKIVAQKLDVAAEHLRTLIQDSVAYAISHCDDPKVLKELLANVERM